MSRQHSTNVEFKIANWKFEILNGKNNLQFKIFNFHFTI
jgi:hypothetical protein